MADERKRRRMESNRESARRSRVKKQQQLQQVISDIDHYKRQNIQIGTKLNETEHRCSVLESEIENVETLKMDLERRLCELNSIIDEAEAAAVATAADDVVSPTIWRVGSWTDDLKVGCGDGLGCWVDGLGIDLDVSVNLSPWRMRLAASSSTATLSRT